MIPIFGVINLCPRRSPRKKVSTSVGSWWVSNATKHEIPSERERGKETEKNGETLKRERLVLVVGAGGIVGSRRPRGVKNETELAASESERLPLLAEKESGTDINLKAPEKNLKFES